MATPLDAFAGLLAELLEAGVLPASRVSTGARKRLRPLLDSGVLGEARSGAGKVISVANSEIFNVYIRNQYPAGLFDTSNSTDTLDLRTASLLHYRDTKALGTLDFEVVEFRLCGVPPLMIGAHASSASQAPLGLGALVLHDRRRDEFPLPRFSGNIATVENPTMFISFPWAVANIDLAIATYGRMSARLVAWLASLGEHGSRVTHFGDYDPVGLSEFLRLQASLGELADLFIPDNLDDLISQFGNRELLTRSASLIPRLSQSNHPKVQRVLAMMQRHSCGLEQEVLLGHRTELQARHNA